MVKKSSFLEKLRSRFSSSPVRVKADEPRRTAPASAPKAEPITPRTGGNGTASSGRQAQSGQAPGGQASGREAPGRREVVEPPHEAVARPIAERASSRKMSRQEEAKLTMEKGLSDLTGQIRTLTSRLEGPAAQLARLPEISQAQLEALRSVVDRLERQEASQTRIENNLSALPSTLEGVQQALERAAATDARTADTVDQFKAEMQRIQSSMGDLVTAGQGQAEATREALSTNRGENARIVQDIAKQNRDNFENMRRSQVSQTDRLERIAGEGRNGQRAVVGLLGAVLVALVVIAALLIAS